jgi:hypothetical protein
MKFICFLACFILSPFSSDWLSKKENGYIIYYRDADKTSINEYNSLIKKGMNDVKCFFGDNYKNQFAVYVHPDRKSLDSTWEHDWKIPEFKSECWMVASGIADRLDMISPKQWSTQSCEHNYSNKEETQKLITHELVHVFHAQHNKSKDFSETENLDWFVEGLATYASGQLTPEKILQIKQAIKENQTPSSLNDFWKGKMRYQQSGCMVMFIDKTYGRKKLISLLLFTRKSEVLSALNVTEEKLLSDWKNYLLK